jgi:hypothetical protein
MTRLRLILRLATLFTWGWYARFWWRVYFAKRCRMIDVG